MGTVAIDRRERRAQQGVNQEGERGHGALLLLVLAGALGGGVWYYEAHHCNPACGPCQTCKGGHCTTNCAAGQVCGPDGKTCVTPLPPGSCNPACAAGQVCANGTCVPAPCNPPCGAGQACTSGQCVAIPCNPPCGGGTVCSGGQCVCPGGTTWNGSSCVSPPPPPVYTACDYVIRGGDMLIDIAPRIYGFATAPDGNVTWEWLYNQNPQIRQIAEQHGYYSNWWHWIWPGEVIHCPPYPWPDGSVRQPNCNI